MCGISGQVGKLSEKSWQARALASISHRGPDAEDNWWSDRDDVWLAQRRLAIVDLSDAGKQPMYNEDRSIWMVCNGEIYNYPSLRPRLEALGHQFYSDCDVESLIHAYEQWGDAFVEQIEGMFALAIWDSKGQRLLMARDRVGIKPLYYMATQSGISFASEARALLELTATKPPINPQALAYIMTLGYVPSPLSMWQGICKLEAGHILTWSTNKGIQVQCYWEPPREIDPKASFDLAEWSALFHTVVREHLQSDVPLGMFLSGGLDSSSIALALKDLQQSITALTISYPTSQFDESPIARELAQQLDMPHIITPIRVDDVTTLVQQVSQAYDEPQSYSALLSMYLVSKVGASRYKVILAGDGGDEVFGGYSWYDNLPSPKSPSLRGRVKNLLGKNTSPSADLWETFARQSPLHRHASRLHPRFFPQEAQELLQATGINFSVEDMLAPLKKYFVETLPLKRALQRVDLMSFCTDSILAKVDRASMAHSLEVRVPFLDRRVIEWGLSQGISDREQVESKQILRDFMKAKVPDSVLNHPKQGFSLRVLNDFDWSQAVEHIADSKWVQDGYWAKNWREMLNPSMPYHTSRIWNLYMLSCWADHWL